MNEKTVLSLNTDETETPRVKAEQPSLDFNEILKAPIFQYVSNILLTILKDKELRKYTLEKSLNHVRIEKYLQAGVVFTVIIASSLLASMDRFDSSMGVLFGTLIGYMYGKKG
tara:strand:+ start:2002 stop:2340 length:339 start_codon:yes stop_codon:yes gene_type:complete